MKSCIFCSRASNTVKINKEHVFRKKNRALFGRRDTHTNIIRFSTADGNIRLEKPMTYKLSPYEQTVGGICEICNSGWLNKIDLDFERLQFRLIKNLSIMGGQSDIRLIYTWAYKTALIRTLTDRSCERAVSYHHLNNFYRTQHPDLNVGIWLFNGNNPIDTYSRHDFGVVDVDGLKVEYNQVTIAMGSMGIYVLMFGPSNLQLDPKIVEGVILRNTGNTAKRMWPDGENFVWPLNQLNISDEAISNISISLSKSQNKANPIELVASYLYMSAVEGSERK